MRTRHIGALIAAMMLVSACQGFPSSARMVMPLQTAPVAAAAATGGYDPSLGFDPKTLVNSYDRTTGWGGVSKEDLDNFHIVDPTLFRGARPSKAGMETLKRLGIRTIINLESRQEAVKQEMAWAQALGIDVVPISLSTWVGVPDASVDKFLTLTKDPAKRPLYFHCMQGRDRTGALGLVYRVTVQHWQPHEAIDEMDRHGFHKLWFLLNRWAKNYAKEKYVPAPKVLAPVEPVTNEEPAPAETLSAPPVGSET